MSSDFPLSKVREFWFFFGLGRGCVLCPLPEKGILDLIAHGSIIQNFTVGNPINSWRLAPAWRWGTPIDECCPQNNGICYEFRIHQIVNYQLIFPFLGVNWIRGNLGCKSEFQGPRISVVSVCFQLYLGPPTITFAQEPYRTWNPVTL